MKIRWVRLALEHLRRNRSIHVQRKSVCCRKDVVSCLGGHQYLREHPYIGRPGRVSVTRELVISDTPFVIPYRVVSDEIQILRVLHGALQWLNNFE